MKQLFFAVLALVVLLLLSCVLSASKIRELKTEIEAQKQNVDILKNGEREYRMKDSTKAVEIQALQLDKKQFNELIKEKDKQIEMIRAQKNKTIEYFTEVTKTDSFCITKFDTVYIGTDTCFGYNDGYLSFLSCRDTAFFETHDTIKQTISKQYKHRFLWWKWGLNGVTQDIWSTNPHSSIHFDDFIKLSD